MAGKFWREAATLMVISRAFKSNSMKSVLQKADYEVLFLKRSRKSKFMPQAYVFPGGTIDSSDSSPHWCQIFEECGFSQENLKKTFRISKDLPELYSNKIDGKLLPELAFRICAIRETFEETGLLLRCDHTVTGTPVLSTATIPDSVEWRKKVMEDASSFKSIFLNYGGCPWVWGLHDWSDWLTPTLYGEMKRRFDTAFYITFLDGLPELCTDNEEAEIIDVSNPYTMMERWQQEELWLAPPQVYELSRLLQFKHYKELKKFSIQRAIHGLERYLPVRLQTADGWISLLPGDSFYPKNPDLIGSEDGLTTSSSMFEHQKMATNLHRMEISGLFKCTPVINIDLPLHIGPKTNIFSKVSNL